MIYDDTDGIFTAMLIDKGYVDGDEWQTARPKYYFEVKTTIGPCNSPFYMSKHQYRRLRQSQLSRLLVTDSCCRCVMRTMRDITRKCTLCSGCLTWQVRV